MGRAWTLSVVLTALAVAVCAEPSVAQQTPQQTVDTRRVDYEAAKKEWEAANLRYKNIERAFDAALMQFQVARRSGDEDAINRAFADAQARSVADAEQKQRVTNLASKLRTARRSLTDAINARLEDLLVQIDSASSRQRRQVLNAAFTDLNNELRDLDQENREAARLSPVVLPDITYDPRDTSQELEQKAEILDRRAEIADTLIDSTRVLIKQLQDRQRRERQRRDFMAGTGRFDDTRNPVIAGGTGGDDNATPADSTGTNARPVTLDERIRALQEHLDQLKEFRDQLRLRAAQFRGHVRMVT